MYLYAMRQGWFFAISVALYTVVYSTAFSIVNGDEVKTEKFSSVYRLEGTSGDYQNSISTYCSATLIHPKILLTAAHCFKHDAIFRWATQGKNGGRKSSKRIDTGKPHPKWETIQNKVFRAGYDIGYILLEDSVSEIETKPAEILTIDTQSFSDFLFKQVQLVGFGISSDLLPEPSDEVESLIGYKRTSFQAITQVTPKLFVTSGLNGALAPGDSGGGLFIETHGSLKLIGVNSEILPNETNTDRQSLFSVLREETLCWVVQETGIALDHVNCPK